MARHGGDPRDVSLIVLRTESVETTYFYLEQMITVLEAEMSGIWGDPPIIYIHSLLVEQMD